MCNCCSTTVPAAPLVNVDLIPLLTEDEWRNDLTPELRIAMLRNKALIYAEDQSENVERPLSVAGIRRWVADNVAGFVYITECDFHGRAVLFERREDFDKFQQRFKGTSAADLALEEGEEE